MNRDNEKMPTTAPKISRWTLGVLFALGAQISLLPAAPAQDGEAISEVDDNTGATAVEQNSDNSEAQLDPDSNGVSEDDEGVPHKGVFFRLTLGAGFGWYYADGRAPPKPGLRGLDEPEHMSLLIGGLISLGGYIVENWGLHFDMGYQGMPFKKTDPTSQEYGTFSAGLGLTHYFMPYNLYLTGSVRWSRVLLRRRDAVVCWFREQFNTYDGIGGFATFGKEWRPRRTGFGLGLELSYVRTFSELQDFNVIGAMLVATLTTR